MSETTTKSGAIRKREALRLAKLPVDGDWPESVTPAELAAMQYPCDYTTAPEARKLAQRKQRDIAAEARKAIDAGELPTVPAVRQVSALAKATEIRNSWVMGGPRLMTRLVRVPAESREVQAIERRPCRTWLDAIGESPNEYVRAWLGNARQEEAQEAMKAAPAATPLPTVTTKERRIAAIVATACSLKYEPQKIAWGGKAAIKVECLKDAKLFTDSTFDKAWQAAVKAEKIRVENSDTYTKR